MATKKTVILEKAIQPARTRFDEVQSLVAQNEMLVENLAQVTAMFQKEDQGWSKAFVAEQTDGLTLDELKEWSIEIHNAVVGNPFIKRGSVLRSAYVWQDGIKYREGTVPGKKQGKGTNVQALMQTPINQRNFFGAVARAQREKSLYTDGLAIYLGDDTDMSLRALPLREITGHISNPDHSEEIWAYRRSWSSYVEGEANPVERNEWYFTDTFWDKRRPSIKNSAGKPEPVSQKVRAFDMHANRPAGFAYGSPDALAALVWSRIFKNLVQDGVTMTSALATFAFKASVASKNGAENVSMKLANASSAGSTATVGGANDLVPLSSAGKTYDFASLAPVAAVVASSLDVSAEALTSTTSAGSLTSLDFNTRLAMEARRAEHVELDRRVMLWLGAPDAEVYFNSMDDSAEGYRMMQSVVLRWGTGLYGPDEIKEQFEELLGKGTFKAPFKGVVVPNNIAQVNAAKPDVAPVNVAAPDQGTGNGTGGQDNSGNDIRNDS